MSEADDITGIYRWVNKIYELQVVNYGKRFMLEFIVPEPAAFLRFAYSSLPGEIETLVKPDPPGYCSDDGQTFEPLKVEDIDESEYLFWVSKYNVQDVSTPPAPWVVVTKSKVLREEIDKTTQTGAVAEVIDIPEGYMPLTAGINYNGTDFNDQNPGNFTIQIQDQEMSSVDVTTTGSYQSKNLYNSNPNGNNNKRYSVQY
jgi:hypothetical protein